jgi:MATE family multidrug resistance protein
MLWGIGLAGGYILAYEGLNWGSWNLLAQPIPQTFWMAATAALLVVAFSFVVLLLQAMQQSVRAGRRAGGLTPP